MISANNLAPRQKILLTASLWLAALLATTWLILAPLVSQIKNDGRELAQKKQEMESFYADWQLLEKSQKDYQAKQDELYGLPAILPPSDTLKFIILIEKLAQATNNQQTVAVNETAAANRQEKKSANFQISLRGQFPDLIKFLVYLESAPYYNKINNLNARRLTAKESEGESGGLNTILNVSAY